MFRRTLTLLLVMFLLAFGGAALAQSQETFCGDLPAADCDLLARSEAAMAALDSASIQFGFNMTFSGIPDAPDPLIISLAGTGSYTGAGALTALESLMVEGADPAAVANQVLDALAAFNGDLSLILTLPAEMTEEIPSPIVLNLRLVSGVGYVDFDALQPLTNDPSMTGWGGLDIVNLVRDLLRQQPDLFDQLGAMAEMSTMGMTPTLDDDMMARFEDPEFLARFLSIQRLPDENGLAVFETTMDFGALFSEPAMQEMMRQQMQMQMEMSGETMSDADMAMMTQMMSQMFQGFTFILRQVIEPDTAYMRSTSGSGSLDMTSALADAGAPVDGPVLFAFDISINMTNFNSAPAITAPEGAVLFPYQMLLGMMEDMGEMMPAPGN
jgi:hypothetical protein